MKYYKRNPSGRIIPPSKKDDAEQALFSRLMPGDIVITSSLTNLSSSTDGILRTLSIYLDKQVRLISILDEFDSDLIDMYTFQLFRSVSDNVTRNRWLAQRQGIQSSQNAGNYHKKITPDDLPTFDSYYEYIIQHTITKTEAARRLQISRPTLDKLIAQYEQERYRRK